MALKSGNVGISRLCTPWLLAGAPPSVGPSKAEDTLERAAADPVLVFLVM